MDVPFIDEGNGTRIGPDYIGTNPGTAIPYLTITSIASVGGTLGNVLVICAVLTHWKLHTVHNVFIINLAIADLCVTSLVDPFSIVGMVKGEQWFDNKSSLCEFVAWLCLMSCYCSLLNIGAIALNRYVYICKNHIYDKIYTMRNTIAMCVVLWVVTFLAEMPNFFGWGDHVYDSKTLSCVWDRTADLSYTIFTIGIGIGVPVVLITICYALIYRHIMQSGPTVKLLLAVGQMAGARKDLALQKQIRQQLITFFSCFVVFTVCWAPYAFVVALDYKDTYPLEVHLYAILFAHINSSLNCIIYGISNPHFRDAFYRLLGLHLCFTPSYQRENLGSSIPQIDKRTENAEFSSLVGKTADTQNVTAKI